jgi:hypothetical protein
MSYGKYYNVEEMNTEQLLAHCKMLTGLADYLGTELSFWQQRVLDLERLSAMLASARGVDVTKGSR